MNLDQLDGRLQWRLAPALFLTPDLLDFGRLSRYQKEVRELYVTSLHGPIEHCTVVCSEENSWFRLLSAQGMNGHESGLVKLIVEVDAARLTAGQSYRGWIEVSVAQAQTRVHLLAEVRADDAFSVKNQPPPRILQPILVVALVLGGMLFLLAAVRMTALTDQLLFAWLARRPPSDFNVLAFAAADDATLTLHLTKMTPGGQQKLALSGWSPAWSPDGAQLAFLSDQSGAVQLHLLPTTGSAPKVLTSSPELKFAPAWSPDGSKLAYIAGQSGQGLLRVLDSHAFAWGKRAAALADNTALIAAVNDLFTGLEQLGKPASFTQYFAWSPDGRALLFDYYHNETVQILHVNTNGIATSVATDSWSPAWSPNSKMMAAVSAQGLFRLVIGQQERHYLSHRPAQAPAWSPTGKQIAFLAPLGSLSSDTAKGGPERLALWLVDVIDGQERVLVPACVAFAWSPDGQRLAYVTGDTQSATPLFYLWLMTPGAQPTLLAEIGDPAVAWKPLS